MRTESDILLHRGKGTETWVTMCQGLDIGNLA